MYNSQNITPVLIPIREAFDKLGIGVTTGYALIGQGKLTAVKLGQRTMITNASLHEFVANLPPFVSNYTPA